MGSTAYGGLGRERGGWRVGGRSQTALSRVCAVAPSLAASSLFFFQAEDGIRDKLVTGVQTCALPILAHGVDHHVDSDLVSRQPILHRITGFVDPFPRVAQIGITRHEGDQPSILILDTDRKSVV